MSRLTESKRVFLIPALLIAGLTIASGLEAVMPSLIFASAQTSQGPEAGGGGGGQTTGDVTGTISAAQAARDFLNTSLNKTMIDAATAAEHQIQNGAAVEGRLNVVQGFLVYNITVADTNTGNAYRVFVDPATGQALSISSGIPIDTLALPTGFDNATKTLIDAADVAESQVQNGIAIAGAIETVQGTGALVYNITVVDVNNGTLHKTMVDPTTGNVVSTPETIPIGDIRIEGIF
jgi:uncharacterized membrane protein YkoI